MSTTKNSSIRVLLADDHPLLVAGFAMSLSGQGITVVGDCALPDAVVSQYRDLLPDVLVLDIRFGVTRTGLDAAKDVLAQFPQARIVFLSQYDQDNVVKEAYALGGYAFVTKGTDPGLLATAIKRAHEGQLYFLPQVAERLATLSVQGDMSPQARLEAREVRVFVLMAQGLTNSEIADQLAVSPKTISNTSQTIKEKLGIYRAADITRTAVRHGLLEP